MPFPGQKTDNIESPEDYITRITKVPGIYSGNKSAQETYEHTIKEKARAMAQKAKKDLETRAAEIPAPQPSLAKAETTKKPIAITKAKPVAEKPTVSAAVEPLEEKVVTKRVSARPPKSNV